MFCILPILNSIFMSSGFIRCSLLLLLAGGLMAYDMPKGWRIGGNRPNDYEMGVEVGSGQNGKNAATIRSYRKEAYGYGVLEQRISSDNYKGKRIKLTGFIKTKNVDHWAGLLMKVESKCTNPVTGKEQRKIIAFDNMYNRLISGNTDFTKYEVILDVPDSASDIEYGARLTGAGQIWFDGLKFEVVGKDVAVTSSELKEPTNLDFNN